jgi:hypothetical protein
MLDESFDAVLCNLRLMFFPDPFVLVAAGALAVIVGWIADWLRTRQGSGATGTLAGLPGRTDISGMAQIKGV